MRQKGREEGDQMEKVYRDREGGRWVYFTYSDGQRVFITKGQADLMVRQGAALVEV